MSGWDRTPEAGADRAPVLLWDRFVRLSHWAIAVTVLWNEFITKGGSTAHVWLGWIALIVLVLRLIWGFIGSKEARFSAFPPNPAAAFAHIKTLLRGKPKEHASHNPAGALMIYALWMSLAVICVTGLEMSKWKSPMTVAAENEAVANGDWSVMIANNSNAPDIKIFGESAEDIHEIASDLILFLVLIHVGGVIVESFALKRNLIMPMLYKGKK